MLCYAMLCYVIIISFKNFSLVEVETFMLRTSGSSNDLDPMQTYELT